MNLFFVKQIWFTLHLEFLNVVFPHSFNFIGTFSFFYHFPYIIPSYQQFKRMVMQEIWKRGVDLSYVIDAYRNLNLDDHFFRPFFELLVGRDYVRKMIKEGKSADEIKAMWKDDVEKFKVQRKPYLLYEE